MQSRNVQNRTSLELLTPPASLPVTLTQVKEYLRIDGSDEDTTLNAFISAATNLVERFLGQKLISQTWIFWLDEFPSSVLYDSMLADGVTEGKLSEFLAVKNYIEIPVYPLQGVNSLKVYERDDSEIVFASSNYEVEKTTARPGRLALRRDAAWPSNELRTIQGVRVEFVAGYGDPSDVPEAIKQAILETIGKFYNSRGCEENSMTLPQSALALLMPFRIPVVY